MHLWYMESSADVLFLCVNDTAQGTEGHGCQRWFFFLGLQYFPTLDMDMIDQGHPWALWIKGNLKLWLSILGPRHQSIDHTVLPWEPPGIADQGKGLENQLYWKGITIQCQFILINLTSQKVWNHLPSIFITEVEKANLFSVYDFTYIMLYLWINK